MENTNIDKDMSFFGSPSTDSQLKSTENPYGIPQTTSESYTEYQGSDILGNILGFILFTIILLLVILFVAYAIESRKDAQPITFFSYLRYLGKTGSYFSQKVKGEKEKRERKEEVDHIHNDLHTALDKYPSSQTQTPTPTPTQTQDEKEYEPSQSQSQSQSKNGWCYIGETNNKRSCAPVDADEKCMSGNIFPSYDLCVNPNLR
jgi:hypothetical protein